MLETFKKYPLVQKAYHEQKILADGVIPETFATMISRCVDIIDTYVDRPAAEKEGVMVVCILMTGSPFVFDEPSRFEKQYTSQIQAFVNSLLEEKVAENDDYIQASAAISIFAIENAMEVLKNNPPKGAALEELKTSLQAVIGEKNKAEQNVYRTSPRLATVLKEVTDTFSTSVDQLAGAPAKKKNSSPKPPAR